MNIILRETIIEYMLPDKDVENVVVSSDELAMCIVSCLNLSSICIVTYKRIIGKIRRVVC
jgi:hypothetical protein